MNKRVRLILILVFAVLFLITTPTILLYSKGYRFDFETKKIMKIGAISIKAQPESCDVYLNNKLLKKTNFLLGSCFLNNLLPKKYNVRVEKEGYVPWEKNLEVKEELLTQTEKIILFPENLSPTLLLADIEEFLFSPDENKIALAERRENGRVFSVFDLRNGKFQTLFTEERDLETMHWSQDSEVIMFDFQDQQLIVDTSKEEPEIFPLNYFGNIQEISLNLQNNKEIFFIKTMREKDNLFKSNYQNKELNGAIAEDIETYKVSNGNLIWLDKKGFLSESNLAGEEPKILNEEALEIKEAEYEIEDGIFIREDNILYQLRERTLEKILDTNKEIKPSPGNNKLCLFNNLEISILFLEDIEYQPYRIAGDKIFLTRFSEKIDHLFWLTSDYLIFNTGNNIKIAEIDDRDKINIIKIAEFENPEIFWSQVQEKLYIKSNNSLYFIENLLP